jgi:hypothetical protein
MEGEIKNGADDDKSGKKEFHGIPHRSELDGCFPRPGSARKTSGPSIGEYQETLGNQWFSPW